MQFFHLALRLGPGSLFLWAGVTKALDRQQTILAVDAYRVLPHGLVTPVAVVLPWVEIALGAFLVAGLFVRLGGAAVAALTVLFIAGMAQARARGLPIDCGCFGGGPGDGVSWWDMARDLPLLAAGAWLAWRPEGPFQLDRLILTEGDHDEHEGS